jgi:4-amino-4-deoxy-L-arabinose transferase-like glycosyltransferase
MLLGACSPRDLWPPDEPRYGQVAREMLEHGHWLVTHTNGEPDAEKPPLFYWLVACLSWPLGGVTALLARLTAALLAALCVPAILRLARAWFSERGVGVTAVALFAANALVAWNASRAGLDLPLTCAILWAVERGEHWRRTGSLHAAAAFGLCWAAAVLIKGPLGLLLPPAVVGAAMIALRRSAPARNLGWGWAVAVLALVVPCLAWLLPAMEAGGEAYRARLLPQMGDRVTGTEPGHLRPFWYFLEVGPAFLLPMTGFLILGYAAALKPSRGGGVARAGLAAALVGGPLLLLFLSSIATKRDLYLIPGLPFVALAAAWVLHRGLWPRAVRACGGVLGAASAGAALVLLFLPVLERRLVMPESSVYGEPLDPARWIALVPAAAFLAWAAVFAWRRRADPVAQVRGAALAWSGALVVFAFGHLPALDPHISFQRVAAAAERAAGDGPIAVAGWYQGPNLLWSLHRARVGQVTDASGLAEHLAPRAPRTAVVASSTWWQDVQAQAARDPALAARLTAVRETWRDQVGSRLLVVLTNAPP